MKSGMLEHETKLTGAIVGSHCKVYQLPPRSSLSTVFMLIKWYNFKIHYLRIGIVEIPGNEFASLEWMDLCNRYIEMLRCVWREIVCDRCYSRKWASNCHPTYCILSVCDCCSCTIPGTGRLLPCHHCHALH